MSYSSNNKHSNRYGTSNIAADDFYGQADHSQDNEKISNYSSSQILRDSVPEIKVKDIVTMKYSTN